jgi:hypothetical protein
MLYLVLLVFGCYVLPQVRISPGLEALLAPALLPRGYINQQLLLAIREVSMQPSHYVTIKLMVCVGIVCVCMQLHRITSSAACLCPGV